MQSLALFEQHPKPKRRQVTPSLGGIWAMLTGGSRKKRRMEALL